MAGAILALMAALLASCSLAGDITPPPGLATAQAGETLVPATPAATEPSPTGTIAPVSATQSKPSQVTTPAATSVVRGAISNGTPGGSVPEGLEVVLTGFDGDQQAYQQTTAVSADGTYTFTDVPVVSGRVYGVAVTYDDILYFSEGAHLTGDGQPLDLPVTVFDITPDAAELSVERLHILFDFSVASRVQVMELWVISNSGERTVVAAPEHGAIEVTLPADAADLAFEDGSMGGRYVQTADGFGDTEPIVPGTATSQFIFSYWLPYDGSLTFVQPTGLPVSAVVVLMPNGGVTASGPGIQDMGAQKMADQTVRAYGGPAIPAGQALEIKLSGQPQPESASAGTGNWANAAIGLGVLGVALILAGLWWFRPARAHRRPPSAKAQDQIEALLRTIADLDDALEAGAIDATEHRARRSELKRQLRERMG